jgi:hypothetical protein
LRHNAIGRFEAYETLLAWASEAWLDENHEKIKSLLDQIENKAVVEIAYGFLFVALESPFPSSKPVPPIKSPPT